MSPYFRTSSQKIRGIRKNHIVQYCLLTLLKKWRVILNKETFSGTDDWPLQNFWLPFAWSFYREDANLWIRYKSIKSNTTIFQSVCKTLKLDRNTVHRKKLNVVFCKVIQVVWYFSIATSVTCLSSWQHYHSKLCRW